MMRMLSLLACLHLAILLPRHLPAAAEETPTPWFSILLKEDRRSKEMRRFDKAIDQQFLNLINSQVEIAQHFVFEEGSPEKLVERHAPVAVLHYSPVRQPNILPEEQAALRMYLERGGFLVLFENAYAHDSPVLHTKTPTPLSDFLLKTLTRDPKFKTERPPVNHAIYRQMYNIELPDSIVWERKNNPYSRDGTMLYYEDRPVAFVMTFHGYDTFRGFVGLREPYGEPEWIPAGYELILNVLVYATSH